MQSLAQLLLDSEKLFPQKTLYQEKVDGTYQSVSYSEFKERVFQLAKAFLVNGLQKDDKIALLSSNSIHWSCVDYATLSCGLVTVPIYPNLLSEHIAYILENSEAKVICVENQFQLNKIKQLDRTRTQLQTIIVLDNSAKSEENGILNLSTFLKSNGSDISDDEIIMQINKTDKNDVASIIYTSGTTGLPKGVMMTHENFLFNVEASLKVLTVVNSEDLFLSFLPLCHVFERMAGHFLPMKLGATIAFAESIDTVAQNLLEVRPTVMTAVPRLYEKIYDKVKVAVENGPALKRKLFNWAIGIGKEVVSRYTSIGKEPVGLLAVKYAIANALVFSKLKKKVGGRVRYFISGGGALIPEIGEFFCAAGLIILEGYGLTETAPVIAVNKTDHFKFGFVGPALPGIELKIADDGEILTRSKSVMKGYFKNDAATHEAIDTDGWFRTGDIGYLDDDNFLKITDRKKNIIVTSGGKNIAPGPIEASLINTKYIDQAVVIGNGRNFCTAIIVLSEETIKTFIQSQKLTFAYSEAPQKTEIIALIQNELDKLNKNLPRYETIKKFILRSHPFTIENGELTPTLKTKRSVIEKNNKHLIDLLYQ